MGKGPGDRDTPDCNWLCRHFAAGRPVEDHPDGEVVGEILEPVLGTGGDEHHIARPERIAPAIVEQDAAPADDRVDLVLVVRRLPVRVHRQRQLQVQRAALEHAHRVLTGRTGNSGASRRKGNDLTAIAIGHGRIMSSSRPGRKAPAEPPGMMSYPTRVPKTKVALTLDADLVDRVDELVAKRRFRNRSQAIEAALADKLRRLARTRLATESAKLNVRDEKRLADEGLADDFESWPEY